MKIFISIASYQDPLLEATLRSAYDKSDMPKNLVFGVCDQSSKSLNLESIEFRSQIKYEHINPLYSKGPCWARSRIQDNFNEEDYYLQTICMKPLIILRLYLFVLEHQKKRILNQ